MPSVGHLLQEAAFLLFWKELERLGPQGVAGVPGRNRSPKTLGSSDQGNPQAVRPSWGTPEGSEAGVRPPCDMQSLGSPEGMTRRRDSV